jgi:hypothetical protein
MAEAITLTTPAVAAVSHDYQVVYLELDWERARIVIRLLGPDGKRLGHNYQGATALTLMRGLNTANLSLKSLQRRVLERLVADGVLSGTINGVPD